MRARLRLVPKRYSFIVMVLLCVSCVTNVQAQQKNSIVDQWKVQNGLPQHSVNDIVQTPDGYLWLGTEGGIVRFDGVRFITFDRSNTSEIQSNRIASLAVDSSGVLYFGTRGGGLSRYRDGVFENINAMYGLPLFTVNSVIIDNTNRVWFTSGSNGIYYYDGNEPVHVENTETWSNYPMLLEDDGKGTIIAMYSNQIRRVTENGTTLIYQTSGPEEDDLRNIVYDRERDRFLIGRRNDMLVIQNNTIQKHEYGRSLKTVYDLSVSTYPDVGILIHSVDDYLVVDPETLKPVETDIVDQLKGTTTRIFIDAEGNTWIGTTTEGLLRIRNNPFSLLELDGFSLTENVYGSFIDSKDNLWLSTSYGDVFKLKPTSDSTYSIKHSLVETVVYSFIEDEEDNIFIGTFSYGLERILENGKSEEYALFPDSLQRWVFALYKDRNDRIWVGSENGLFYMEDGLLRNDGLPRDLSGRDIHFFYEDSRGVMWVSSDVIYSFDGSEWKNWGLKIPEANQFFRGITELPNGKMVFGTYGNGIVYLDPDSEKGTIITRANGLVENVASYLYFDENLWITGNNGLTFIRYPDLLDYVEGRTTSLNAILYNRKFGAPTDEFHGGFQNSGLKWGEKEYIFPSLNGFVKIDFSSFKKGESGPTALIEEVYFGGRKQSPYSDLVLDYSTDRIEFVYTAPNFLSAEETKFRYRLYGVDKEWVDAGKERRISYTDLRPGEYVFEVLAGTSDGIWSDRIASIPIKVVPPFYMTGWFRVGIALLGFGVFGIMVYAGVQRSNKRQRERSALMDVLPDLIFKLDKFGTFLELFGTGYGETPNIQGIIGKKIDDVLPATATAKIRDYMTQASITDEIQVFEFSSDGGLGGAGEYEGRIVGIDSHSILFIIRNITDRKKAEQELIDKESKLQTSLHQKQQLIKQIENQQKAHLLAIVEAQEKERRRMAVDLHDSIGQLLSSVKLNLSVAGQADTENQHARQIVKSSQSMIDAITQEIRNISYNLLPSSLERFGLVTAIEEQIRRLEDIDQLNVHFIPVTNSARFPEVIETSLFRVFQEVFNNSLKHSQATEIHVQIVEHDTHLSMIIEDDGVGFDFDQVIAVPGGNGLKNIISRVSMIGGDIHFDTGKVRGTTVTITAPLQPNS